MSNALAESRGSIPRRAAKCTPPMPHEGLPFAVILGETLAKIDRATLSRCCGTPRRISPNMH